MKLKTKAVTTSVEKKLTEMKNRVNRTEGFLARVIWPLYQKAQTARFKSQNLTEGDIWPELTFQYYKWKTTHSYISKNDTRRILGQGKQMLVLTGELADALIKAKGKGSRVIAKNKMIINVSLDYSEFVNEERNFTEFSKQTATEWSRALNKYVRGN